MKRLQELTDRFSIRLVALAVVTCTLPLLVFSWYASSISTQGLKVVVHRRYLEHVRHMTDRIDSFIGGHIEGISRAATKDGLRNGHEPELLRRLLEKDGELRRVALVRGAKVLAVSSRGLEDQQWAGSVRLGAEPFVNLYVAVKTPGSAPGTVVAVLRVGDLWDETSLMAGEKPAYAYIVNRQGSLVFDPGNRRPTGSSMVSVAKVRDFLAMEKEGDDSGMSEYAGYGGRSVIGVYHEARLPGWG